MYSILNGADCQNIMDNYSSDYSSDEEFISMPFNHYHSIPFATIIENIPIIPKPIEEVPTPTPAEEIPTPAPVEQPFLLHAVADVASSLFRLGSNMIIYFSKPTPVPSPILMLHAVHVDQVVPTEELTFVSATLDPGMQVPYGPENSTSRDTEGEEETDSEYDSDNESSDESGDSLKIEVEDLLVNGDDSTSRDTEQEEESESEYDSDNESSDESGDSLKIEVKDLVVYRDDDLINGYKYLKSGDKQAACDCFQQSCESGNPYGFLGLYNMLIAEGRLSEAIETIDEFFEDFPGSGYTAIVLRMKGETLSDIGKNNEAIRVLKYALEMGEKTALFPLANCLYIVERYREAEDLIAPAIEFGYQRERSLNLAGMCSMQFHEYSVALTFFQRAIDLAEKQDRPVSARWVMNKAEALHKLENFEQAVNMYVESLTISANAYDLKEKADLKPLWVKNFRILCLLKMGNVKDLMYLFERESYTHSKDAFIWEVKARIQYSRKKYYDALKYCDRAISLDPVDIDALLIMREMIVDQLGDLMDN